MGMNLNQRLDHYRFAAEETASFLDEQAKKFGNLPGKANG
jgi:hypothetical protein